MLVALSLAAVLNGQTAPTASPLRNLDAAPSADCGGLRDTVPNGQLMQCVTAPFDQIGYVALTYAAEAGRHGWTRMGNTETTMWMQKPDAAGTCERMTLVVFWNTREHPIPVAGVRAYLGISSLAGQVCDPLPPATAAR